MSAIDDSPALAGIMLTYTGLSALSFSIATIS